MPTQQQIVVNRQSAISGSNQMSGYISPLGSPQPIMSPRQQNVMQV